MIEHNVRFAVSDDVEALVDLCAEHAAFERSRYETNEKSGRLRAALSAAPPRLRAWVATAQNAIVGYATATEDFSTWSAAVFLHMDCLFVRSSYRNLGIGAALLSAVALYARECGLHEVQWQTPAWNTEAHRFYCRQGPIARDKIRFTLLIG